MWAQRTTLYLFYKQSFDMLRDVMTVKNDYATMESACDIWIL